MSTIALTSSRYAPYAPAPMPMRRVFGAYLAEARFETVRHLKTPAFASPFLIIPVALYMFFSIVGAQRLEHAAGSGAARGHPHVHRIRNRWA